MDVEDVGRWRYCPACAAPVLTAETDAEDPENEQFDFTAPRCSACDRPWIACPCEPDKALNRA